MRRCAVWVTEWSGKIRRNLPVKIFCFTCLLLLAVCIVTYGLIAWMMPVTYRQTETACYRSRRRV